MSMYKKICEKYIVNNIKAQDLLLSVKKHTLKITCYLRSWFKTLSFNRPPVVNIYHAAIQKTASHHVKAVFKDKRIKKHTKLPSFPGHRYEWDEFKKKFPKYHFVPGLFISYGQYEEIKKPKRHRTFYIIRDPRNIIVSWYYSTLETHRLAGKVGKYRKILQNLDLDRGIKFCIQTLQYKFSFMRSWIYNRSDPNVLIVKFENLVQSPFETYKKIFSHCGVAIPDNVLEDVLKDHTKDTMRELEKSSFFIFKRSLSGKSHYRTRSNNWREVMSEQNLKYFYTVNGNLLEELGYEN